MCLSLCSPTMYIAKYSDECKTNDKKFDCVS